MKFAAAVFGIAGSVVAIRSLTPPSQPITLVVTGDTAGYLSPCGCSEPMKGGIKRQATRLRALASQPNVVIVDTGDLVAPTEIGRQDRLKAETLAEAIGNLGIKAVNLTASDARLGLGQLLSLSRSMSDSLITASIQSNETIPFSPSVDIGGVTVVGVSTSFDRLSSLLGTRPRTVQTAVGDAVQAASPNQPIVVMLDGDKDAATALAKQFPMIAAITYHSTGEPPRKAEQVGSTLLITPGERGQHIVSISLNGSDLAAYHVEDLDPTVADDPTAARYFREYLKRVSEERLWEKTPRSKGPVFVGSVRCESCHQESFRVWARSAHSHALRTLAEKGENRDPECLPCHVTGAAYASGFKSPDITPLLANVSCESCHGSGLEHSMHPKIVRMGKVTEKTCESCHTSLNSPRFNFKEYWAKIKHSR